MVGKDQIDGEEMFLAKRVPDGGGVQFECYNDSNINVENGCLKSHQAICCAEKSGVQDGKLRKTIHGNNITS